MLDRRGFLGGVVAVAVGGARLLFATETRTRMYGLIGSMEAVPGRRDDLVAILLEGSRSMPGCLSYVVATDPGDDVTVWVTEVWDSQDSHQASLSAPAVRQAIDRARPLISRFGRRTVTAPAGGHGLGTAAGSPPTSGRDVVGPGDDRVVEVSAHVQLPPAEAFEYFADDALLAAWLAPRTR